MELACVVNQYYDSFMAKHADTLLPSQVNALNCIRRCREPESGEVFVSCTHCHHGQWQPLSCGHRSCPKCQNHITSQWIDRQQTKLLPVLYYMVTFTLPFELRALAYHHQKKIYSLLFLCVAGTLKDFGLNPKYLGAEIGMTMVLHTNNRRLDYHPHIHAVVPGGGIDRSKRQWKKTKGKYLFNQAALAIVFRARFLTALYEKGFYIPKNVPRKWVVDCTRVGNGISALKYLSRYLYRGVISEKNIIANQNGRVTFCYIESKTKATRYRTVTGEDFLHLILQHVLPKGLHKVRDYGLLHGNAKKLLFLVQLLLHVHIPEFKLRPIPVFKCPVCKCPMIIMGFRFLTLKPG